MKIVDRHIGMAAIFGILIAWLLLTGLDALYAFISELDDVGDGDYSTGDALTFVLLTLPRRLYELFPTSALLGALMGVGSLAATSELVAYRAAGISRMRIAGAAVGFSALLLVPVVWMGEYLAPAGEIRAQALRVSERTAELGVARRSGLWVRDGDRVINARRPLITAVEQETVELADVNIFEFEDGELKFTAHAEMAERLGDEWVLRNVWRTTMDRKGVSTEFHPELSVPALIEQEALRAAVTRPQQLSLRELIPYRAYLLANGLDARQYDAALWEKVVYPLTALVMVFAGMPFVFGLIRSGGLGQRLFIGMALGISFFIINKAFGRVGQVYDIPPAFAALLPTLLLAFGSVAMIRRSG
ncbi:MAG: LPS export ABC transporter permease LptG [Lysobacteraceae bacterium]|nr:MAG: LPS export ABC transporter permease LptG [Xanthomonadaceae bacterium]